MFDENQPKMHDQFIEKMVKNLPVLRASIRISQRELANKIGITRQSMMAIETRKRTLQWSTYLALVLIFQQNEESNVLLENLDIFHQSFLD